MLLERLGTPDAPQRHQQQRQQRGPQAVEGRADVAVELSGDPKDTALYQQRDSEHHARSSHGRRLAENRSGVIEQSHAGQQTIEDAIARVVVEAQRRRLLVFLLGGRFLAPPQSGGSSLRRRLRCQRRLLCWLVYGDRRASGRGNRRGGQGCDFVR